MLGVKARDIQLLKEELARFGQQINYIHEREAWTRKCFDDIHGREAWTRERLEEIHEREDWTRKRFDEVFECEDWIRQNVEDAKEYQRLLGKNIAEMNEREEKLCESINKLSGQLALESERLNEIHEREEWTRQRLEEIHERENWTRKSLEEIHEREEWTRQRLEEIHERENWTRGQFDEIRDLVTQLSLKVDSVVSNSSHKRIQDNLYNKKTYSQSGEDAIISYVLNFIGKDLGSVRYLDLGANHAVEMSNSYAYYENGATGVLVEANPELIEELTKARPKDVILNNAIAFGDAKEVDFYVMTGDGLSTISYESAQEAMKANPEISIKAKYQVKTITINEILHDYFESGIDILSIDLEGIEEEILQQIDFTKYRPTVIVLENIPYHPYLVIEAKEDKGGELLRRNDYIEYAFTGINSIYVDRREILGFNQGIIEKIGENN